MTQKIGIDLGMGWIPDYPDIRDFTQEHTELPSQLKGLDHKPIKDMVNQIGVFKAYEQDLPAKQDLSEWCSPIENQGQLGSCTANAAAGMIEYYERRAHGRYIDASRLFIYKVTRTLIHSTGDSGAYLRSTMAAMVLFGAPPEEFWPYKIADFEKEPSAFCFAFAQNYQALQYFRLDPPDLPKKPLLQQIKANLAAGLPSMFGFTVYGSIEQAAKTGKIPFPGAGDKPVGGHAIVCVGYDDSMKIVNTASSQETTGALKIRNSWGTDWGEDGYGWLPYDYVLKGLATDWWTLLKNEWVDTGKFGL
jgi:C1A family cysteine protease